MKITETPFWKWWVVYGKHVEALIIISLFTTIIFVYQTNNKLSEKISENCGYGEDDYYCFCEHSEAMAMKNKFESQGMEGLKLPNVSLDG